jgi:hypothetical protein
MKQMPDRKKLRREYLRKRRTTFAPGGFSIVLLITFLLFECWLIISLRRSGHLSMGLLVFVGVALVKCALMAYKTVKMVQQQVSGIPHVPPVTPNTLPADEILVRASEEPPVAQSDVLLRAAQKGQETPKEELLRVAKE